MMIEKLILMLGLFRAGYSIIGPPVKCHGPVPKMSEGKYYYHDNETYQLRLTTDVSLNLDLGQRSCFQVDILDKGEQNETIELESLFYSVRYVAYQQSYNVRSSYQFGIAELQSFCKCDCPTGQSFCTHAYGKKPCSKGEICITRFHAFQNSIGCANSDSAANLCCEISVKPYKNRRFTAMNLVHPRPHTVMEIEIFTLYQEKWTLFRRYTRKILPYRANTLRLNGFENVADMLVRAQADPAQYYLKNGDKWYFYEENQPEFILFDDRRVNGLHERQPNKFGWLRFENNQWNVGDPIVSLHDLHRPLVKSCKNQKYEDRYAIDSNSLIVIRNSTGAQSAEPYVGVKVQDKQPFIDDVKLTQAHYGDIRDRTLEVTFLALAAPSLKLDIKLHQKLSVIAHMYASYFEDFLAQICLDKNSNRYLNITLIKSYGQFNIEIYRDLAREDVDLVMSMTTNLPFAANYTEILPLPGFLSSSRLVCLHAANKPANRLCKWSTFVKEPIDWYELKNTFIKSEGSCPGCNLEIEHGGFFNNLNPKNWFNGINSIGEGFAMIVGVVIYVIVLIVLIAVWRKCLWPVVKWAACSKGTDSYKFIVKDGVCDAKV